MENIRFKEAAVFWLSLLAICCLFPSLELLLLQERYPFCLQNDCLKIVPLKKKEDTCQTEQALSCENWLSTVVKCDFIMDQPSSSLKETIYFMKVKFYWKHDCCYILFKKNSWTTKPKPNTLHSSQKFNFFSIRAA